MSRLVRALSARGRSKSPQKLRRNGAPQSAKKDEFYGAKDEEDDVDLVVELNQTPEKPLPFIGRPRTAALPLLGDGHSTATNDEANEEDAEDDRNLAASSSSSLNAEEQILPEFNTLQQNLPQSDAVSSQDSTKAQLWQLPDGKVQLFAFYTAHRVLKDSNRRSI